MTDGKETKGDTTNGVVKGSWNHCIGVLGAPGTGKSTYALARAVSFGRDPGAYIFAHDLGFKLPERFPKGQPTGIKRYDTVEQCKRALASDARGVHCISTVDAAPVVELAHATALQSLKSMGGTKGVPSVVLIDEVVSATDASPHRLGEGLRSTLALRRHRHTAIIWTSQSPNLCHYQMMAIGTELVVFRLSNMRDLKPLMLAGFSDEELETIIRLPDHQYIVHHFR